MFYLWAYWTFTKRMSTKSGRKSGTRGDMGPEMKKSVEKKEGDIMLSNESNKVIGMSIRGN